MRRFPRERSFCLYSSGTCVGRLYGCEKPVITEKAFCSGIPMREPCREGFRLNQNIMGLGLAPECRRAGDAKGKLPSWDEIVESGAQAEPFRAFLDLRCLRVFQSAAFNREVPKYCAERGMYISSIGENSKMFIQRSGNEIRYALRELENILQGRNMKQSTLLAAVVKKRAVEPILLRNATGLPVIAGPEDAGQAFVKS